MLSRTCTARLRSQRHSTLAGGGEFRPACGRSHTDCGIGGGRIKRAERSLARPARAPDGRRGGRGARRSASIHGGAFSRTAMLCSRWLNPTRHIEPAPLPLVEVWAPSCAPGGCRQRGAADCARPPPAQRAQGGWCCRREAPRAGERPPAVDRHNPTASCDLGHLRRSRGPGERAAAPDPLRHRLERRRGRQKRPAAPCLRHVDRGALRRGPLAAPPRRQWHGRPHP